MARIPLYLALSASSGAATPRSRAAAASSPARRAMASLLVAKVDGTYTDAYVFG
jgi:hypothetical protein